MLAHYAFLQDVTNPGKKLFSSPYRTALVKKYWQTLQGWVIIVGFFSLIVKLIPISWRFWYELLTKGSIFIDIFVIIFGGVRSIHKIVQGDHNFQSAVSEGRQLELLQELCDTFRVPKLLVLCWTPSSMLISPLI